MKGGGKISKRGPYSSRLDDLRRRNLEFLQCRQAVLLGRVKRWQKLQEGSAGSAG
jgi:hypothetical protein